MDLLHAWLSMGWTQKACFHFVFVVTAVTLVRASRLIAWAFSAADGTAVARRCRTARLWARSTRGLATAAVWLTCAAGAAGLGGAYGGHTAAGIIDDSLHAIDATGVGLSLCASLFATALIFDVVVGRIGSRLREAVAEPRRLRWATAMPLARRTLGILGLVLIAAALVEFRPTLETLLGTRGDDWIASAVFRALGLLWVRLTPIAATLGLLTWIVILVENAHVRVCD